MNSTALILAAAGTDGTTNANSGFFNWWRNSIDQYFDVWSFFWIGALATLVGFVFWAVIFSKIRRREKFWKSLPSIIAHVHHRTIHAGHHIIAALLGFSGASLLAGFLWARMFHANVSDAGYMMTNAGMALGVLTLVLTMWTLNQTMKLERLHGVGIERFDELIKEITKEIIDLVDRYDTNRDMSSNLFRVILVTNNPYFGIISYKGRPVTLDFKNAFDKLADRIKAEKDKNPSALRSGFRVKIICADQRQLNEFLAPYFNKDTDKIKHDDAKKESEEFIMRLSERMGTESIVRAPIKISEAQFAVVGDFVFEFFLEPTDGKNIFWKTRGSNIRATNKIHDRGAADRFEHFARFLEELIQDGSGTVPPAIDGGLPPPQLTVVPPGQTGGHVEANPVQPEDKGDSAKSSERPKKT